MWSAPQELVLLHPFVLIIFLRCFPLSALFKLGTIIIYAVYLYVCLEGTVHIGYLFTVSKRVPTVKTPVLALLLNVICTPHYNN